MPVNLTFRYRGNSEVHNRTALWLRIDGKGNLLLSREGRALSERLKLQELEDLCIAWVATHTPSRKVSYAGGSTGLN